MPTAAPDLREALREALADNDAQAAELQRTRARLAAARDFIRQRLGHLPTHLADPTPNGLTPAGSYTDPPGREAKIYPPGEAPAPAPRTRKTRSSTWLRMRDYIAQHPNQTGAQIAAGVGISRQLASAHLSSHRGELHRTLRPGLTRGATYRLREG